MVGEVVTRGRRSPTSIVSVSLLVLVSMIVVLVFMSDIAVPIIIVFVVVIGRRVSTNSFVFNFLGAVIH